MCSCARAIYNPYPIAERRRVASWYKGEADTKIVAGRGSPSD